MRRILTAGFMAASATSLTAYSGWGSSGSTRNMLGAESNGYNLHAGQNQPVGIPGEEQSNGSCGSQYRLWRRRAGPQQRA